jgi:putative nucleotidyltransferase with HDIG domain
MEPPKIVSEEDLGILVRAGLSEADIRHSILVANKAVEIARRTGKDLDLKLVARGALFHDLGKALTHSYQHGEIGAEMGLPQGLFGAEGEDWRKQRRMVMASFAPGHVRAYFPSLVERGEAFVAYVDRGYWIDIGTPEKDVQVHHDMFDGKFAGADALSDAHHSLRDVDTVAHDIGLAVDVPDQAHRAKIYPHPHLQRMFYTGIFTEQTFAQAESCL